MFKGFRFRRGLTTGDFATQAGVAEEQIKEWERWRGAPSRAVMKDIANAFNVSVFELLEPSTFPGQTNSSPGNELAPPLFAWGEVKQELWGALPYALRGYRLRLLCGH